MNDFLRTPLGARAASAAVAAGTGAIIALSAWLRPSPLGHATHLQLGLGHCSFLTLTGQPCPMCGMTTTFTHMAHLDPVSAAITQPFGVVLFVMTVAAFAVAVAEVLQPRGRWGRLLARLAPYEGRLAALFLVGLSLGWTYKIAVM